MLYKIIALFISCAFLGTSTANAPENSKLVFVKGEGGYYCHKIPYLLRTMSNVLIALAEGRGKDGRDTCDDWNVKIIFLTFATFVHGFPHRVLI